MRHSTFDYHPASSIDWGSLFLAVVLGFFTYIYLTAPFPWTFIDGANLLFHEAGHWLFGGMGMTIGILGGTLLQLLIPGIIMVYFLISRQSLGILFAGWWLGVNLINVGVYMADANAMALPLIGDGTHDWQWLFSNWGMLRWAEPIGNGVRIFGGMWMLAALVIMAGKTVIELLARHQG